MFVAIFLVEMFVMLRESPLASQVLWSILDWLETVGPARQSIPSSLLTIRAAYTVTNKWLQVVPGEFFRGASFWNGTRFDVETFSLSLLWSNNIFFCVYFCVIFLLFSELSCLEYSTKLKETQILGLFLSVSSIHKQDESGRERANQNKLRIFLLCLRLILLVSCASGGNDKKRLMKRIF